jgi:hypothetical protein
MFNMEEISHTVMQHTENITIWKIPSGSNYIFKTKAKYDTYVCNECQ